MSTEQKKQIAEYLRDVGAAVAHARDLAQLDQVQLAHAAGISRRTLIAVEQGRGATLSTLAAICVALDVAPESLGLPRGLLGRTTRVVAAALGLDLQRPRRFEPPAGPLPLPTQIAGVPVPRRRKSSTV